jgi:integrase
MADIRKRNGQNGTTYQVRYPSKTTKSGYAYATFATLKEARAFREDSSARNAAQPRNAELTTVEQAVQRWLDVCEHEGRDGRDPVSPATLAVYKGCASIMRAHDWQAQLHELESADLVAFRSWLLNEYTRDQAKRTLSCFHSMLIEMVTQGVLTIDPAARITIQRSRYKEPVEIPSIAEVQSILSAADRLANHKYKYISQPWERYRAMIYLASDSGLRPQEYLALPTANLLERGIRVTQAVSRSNRIEVPKSPAARRYLPISADVLGMTRHYIEIARCRRGTRGSGKAWKRASVSYGRRCRQNTTRKIGAFRPSAAGARPRVLSPSWRGSPDSTSSAASSTSITTSAGTSA